MNIHEKALESTIETGASFAKAQFEKVNYSWLRKYFEIDDSYLYNKIYLMVYPYNYKEKGGYSNNYSNNIYNNNYSNNTYTNNTSNNYSNNTYPSINTSNNYSNNIVSNNNTYPSINTVNGIINSDSLYRPDLYIPAISIMLLSLFNGILDGFSGKFHPEMLCISFSRNILFHFILCLLYKCISYIFSIKLSYTDIISMAGYKFSIAILSKIIYKIAGTINSSIIRNTIYIMGLGYLYIAYFFFISRSLKRCMAGDSDGAKKTLSVLFGIVAAEMIILVLWIGR